MASRQTRLHKRCVKISENNDGQRSKTIFCMDAFISRLDDWTPSTAPDCRLHCKLLLPQSRNLPMRREAVTQVTLFSACNTMQANGARNTAGALRTACG